MYPKSSIIIWKAIFLYISKIIRNILYIPYASALFLYLFIFITLILGIFLSTDFGVNFLNLVLKMFVSPIVKIFFKLNISTEGVQNISKIFPAEEFKNIFLFIIVSFGILYDLIERVILSFNKKASRVEIRKKFFNIIFWIYGITFAINSILIIFLVKDINWFGFFIAITGINILLLGYVSLISLFFGWILDGVNREI